ncbi:hypothetical protein N0B44_12195 [Roseibacterium beibuensis]|nr:hypothetical protein [Roseibacterium beibuensis]MCS6623674.1 hypothetical protein [Roseibacterium beibuensis]
MKLVTRFEAATLSTPELYGLRKEAFIAFTAAPRGSQEQREALVTMQTIEDELATRAPGLQILIRLAVRSAANFLR